MERGPVYRRVPTCKWEQQPELTSERLNQKNVSVFVDEKRNEKTFSGLPYPVEMTRPEYLETTTPFANRNMWTWETDMEDLTPEDIEVKVNPLYNTLTLIGRRQFASQRRGFRVEEAGKPTNVLKRVVSLPENVDVNQFKTFMTEEGKLILTAPYMNIRGGETKESYIPITINEENTLEKLPLEEMNTINNLPMTHYLRLLKTSPFPGTIGAECVKDEITGEWKLVMDLDTVGFRPEEIRVKFNDEERCLIVKAKREVVGLGNNVFQHELLVPEYVKENDLKWRVLNNGVLRIEMPCEREFIRPRGINKMYRH